MKHLLARLVEGETLTKAQTIEAFELIMTGEATATQMGAFLGLIQQRGPAVEEIAGAASVMRRKVAAVRAPEGWTIVDTCGTGGDHSGTFNISTAAALVVAGAGRGKQVAVAKHGNRSVTSKSGSSQVLEALGVKLQVGADVLTRCLADAGLCFCFAPAHHPAMKHVMPSRMELGFRTIFNVLGPLTNPAGATRQVMGVFSPQLTEPLAQVLCDLGSQRAMVVHGQGLDEIVNFGTTRISEVRDGQVRTYEFDPASAGFTDGNVESLKVDSPEASAAMITRVLAGEPGGPRDIVCLNAGAAIVAAGLCDEVAEGVALAGEAIDNGAAKRSLATLIELTQNA